MPAERKPAVDDTRGAITDTAGKAITTASDVREALTSRLADARAKAGATLSSATGSLVTGAGSTASNLRDIAVETADNARETLSDVGARLAAALERTAAETPDGEGGLKSQVLTTVADGLGRMTNGLRERSVADLADDVKLLAKRHPRAFMAAAAIAGFAAARFVRSSARRQVAMSADDARSGPRS